MPLLKRIGAIGDIHAEDLRLQTCLEFLSNENVDRILAVGDIVDGPGDALRCCQLLQEHKVEAVRGNHDRWFVDKAAKEKAVEDKAEKAADSEAPADELLEYLDALPATRDFETETGRLQLCHGLGENDMNQLTPHDYGYGLSVNDELQELLRSQRFRYVIGGHTHRRMVKDFGGVTVINVGTLLRNHDSCFSLVDFAKGTVTFYEMDDTGRVGESSQHALPG